MGEESLGNRSADSNNGAPWVGPLIKVVACDDSTTWLPDSALAAEVEDQFRRAIESYRIHPDLIAEHANLEESIRTGGYANRTLLELVQNAADALAGPSDGDSLGRVEIVLDTDGSTLYCANGGRPFSRSGLTAITMAHLSGKRGDEIGRFGLGFKRRNPTRGRVCASTPASSAPRRW